MPFQCPKWSSTDTGPELVILQMQIAPGKPEILKSEVPIWDENTVYEVVNAENLMCPYFGILFI